MSPASPPASAAWPAAFAAGAGLLLGSFLNVCIARLPAHRSIAWPGSHCPRCQAPIRFYDNIPLLSYALLQGRCRACHAPISPRYPLVELALATLFAAVALRFAALLPALEAAALCFLLLGLFAMDLETMRLPDSFTLPGLALGWGQSLLPGGGLAQSLALAHAAPFPMPTWPPWLGSLAGAVLASGLLLLIRWLYFLARRRHGMGLGDIKLAALLGAWVGVAGAALTLLLGFFSGALVGVILLRIGNASHQPEAKTSQLPFGSFLCGGAVVTLFFGRPLLTWYFQFWR